jgi:hypothetical protein
MEEEIKMPTLNDAPGLEDKEETDDDFSDEDFGDITEDSTDDDLEEDDFDEEYDDDEAEEELFKENPLKAIWLRLEDIKSSIEDTQEEPNDD